MMAEEAGSATEPPTHGCMECHAQQPYTIEHFANGNTGWRCQACGHILRLIPGKYGDTDAEASA
jgi:hypothetical protein